VVSAGSYVLGVALLAVLAISLGTASVHLRRRLLPEWEGAPGHLVEAVLGVALLIWLSELLGVVNLFYRWSLVGSAVLLAAAVALGPRVLSRRRGAGAALGFSPQGEEAVRDREGGEKEDAAPPRHPSSAPPAGDTQQPRGPWPDGMSLVAIAVIAMVFAHYGLTTADALSRGIFNFDSLWYHQPFAVEMVKSHSVTELHYTETVYVNWAFPQNSELLHAVGILLTERDTLSLFLNFGWLAIAFLAAWCIGRPYGRAPLAVVAAAVVLESYTLVVREPGAGKNDLMVSALMLAAIAVLVHAWAMRRDDGGRDSLEPGWPLAVAGLAVGMAVGTKLTALAMAAALTVAVLVLAPPGRRRAAAGWWFIASLAGGGYWYLRNLVVAGNPLPNVEAVGPISLPHPERLQSGRPDFSIVHYATDTAVWRVYFGPGLDHALGALWPLAVGGAIAGAIVALLWGARLIRWVGGVVLFGLLAYAFTPFTAAGADGEPVGFAINIRYAIPAFLAGLTLLALVRSASLAGGDRTRGREVWTWGLLAALLLVLLVTDRPDAVLRDPDRIFAWGTTLLLVVIPAALWWARSRGAPRGAVAAGFATLALAVAAIGYPVQRDYLRDRFANADSATAIPGMHLDSAYRWARDVEGARIGLAGTTAGFLQYGFYGTDLSNQVRYLGTKGPHGAFNAIPSCAEFRAAVNAADLDYLVSAPFLNFVEPGEPVVSPEAGWLRGEPAVASLDRSGPVTVWRVRGHLDPSSCDSRNAPLREIPQQPAS
jgi:hypothetical protein